jgi:Gpi18-like mannosyltransferase
MGRRGAVARDDRRRVIVLLALPLLFGLGIAIRLSQFGAPDVTGDVDQFVRWVHGIATDGWTNAYDQNLSFPALMAWVWGALAAVQPAFLTQADASDAAIRGLMKVPASLADLGIAAAVAWWFRERPVLALAAAAAVLLWPVTWYVSAWWGQYESLYVLPAVLAVLAARANRPLLVAAFLALSLMTKPQALPFVVPFAAWFLATQGFRGSIKAALVVVAVSILVWLPFIAAGGPLDYLGNLREYQDDIFSVLSLRAWNPWWIVQELGAGGGFVLDSTRVLGPITFRHVGLAVTALLALVVFVGVYRHPSAERLALGLAAISLVAFVCLTTMHERYAYPAFVFLLLALPRRSVLAAWVVLAIVMALNLLVAAPPRDWTIPYAREIGLGGAIAMTTILAITVLATVAPRGRDDELPG